MITFKEVSKSFGSKVVLNNVSLALDNSEIHFIVGHSGAGKSVLIRHAIGLLKPDHGEVWVDNTAVHESSESQLQFVRQKCQMVFQHATLFDSLSMQENIALPLRKRFSVSRKEAWEQAEYYLQIVNCLSYAQQLPGEVGVGIQKRVAIARALSMKPHYILYDEPTTGLDPITARQTDALIKEVSKKQSVGAIVVSHDMFSVRDIADVVTFLLAGEILFHGSVEDFFNSTKDAIMQFTETVRRQEIYS